MAKRELREWSITLSMPPKKVMKAFEHDWPGMTTGAADRGIEKTATTMRLWVTFETDEELHEFSSWFAKQIGMTPCVHEFREYRSDDGKEMVDVYVKLERLH